MLLLLRHAILDEAMQKEGFVKAVGTVSDSTSWLAWPGVPAVRGDSAIAALLALQPGIDSATVMLTPSRLVLSPDTTMVLDYGVAFWDNQATNRRRLGRYLMAWRREPTGWVMEAFTVVNLLDPREVVSPPTDPISTRSGFEATGPAGDFLAADRAFADSMATGRFSSAFRFWAAPDAVTFASSGIESRGPDEVADAVSRMDGSGWAMHPLAVGAADDGSVGWTLGEGALQVNRVAGLPQLVRLKYMTLWQRQPDGTIRFVAMGTSPMP